ncbi:MAG: AMP-binding protein [Bacteroidales bacterium]|nr:AMP-binding protein [Bacteroidales bacterium]
MNPETVPDVNVASHLARLAVECPERVAIYFPPHGVQPHGQTHYDQYTFQQLHEKSDAIAQGLNRVGIGQGTRVALMVPPNLEFFALVFGLFKAAAIPILIDPGLGIRGVGNCLKEAEPTAFIGVPKAHLARRLFGWARHSLRLTVNVGRRRFFCHHSLQELTALADTSRGFTPPRVKPSDPAAVLFTSGSTGPAKGAVYTHGNFAAQVEALKTAFAIRPGEMDLCTFPLFALFGPALGMTCVVPDMDFTRPGRIDPEKAFAQLRQFAVTNLFGSPAVLRRLGAFPSAGGKLVSLKRVISAGAPVPATVIERFIHHLPDSAELFTPYGATESLPVAVIGSREILGETRYLTDQGRGVCVGRPVAGLEVRIIRITDTPIPEWEDTLRLPTGEIGELVVRGPMVTHSYWNRPEATNLAKIRDGDTIWHRMGDVGYFDESGRLWYCGRKSHRVVTPAGTLFTEMVEGVFNTVPGVARTALVPFRRDGIVLPIVCVELTDNRITHDSEAWKQIELDLRERGSACDQTRGISLFVPHPGFPVDIRHNAKINREKLAVWVGPILARTFQVTS